MTEKNKAFWRLRAFWSIVLGETFIRFSMLMNRAMHNLKTRFALSGALGFFTFCIILTASVIISEKARAQCAPNTGPGTIAESTCDCAYLESLESQAWMAAQRQITQNQNLIVKADSVMEYTCFDSFLDVVASETVAGLFSETEVWGAIPGQGPFSTDVALGDSVYETMAVYLGLNFGHEFLGGRVPLDYEPDGVAGAAYSCGLMAEVWQMAKCYNFATMPQDGWFSYASYAETPDRRVLPDPCEDDGRWLVNFDLAQIDRPWWLVQDPINTLQYEYVTEFLLPGFCETPPQPTGVVVAAFENLGHGVWPDAFCTNPGCDYDGAGCTP